MQRDDANLVSLEVNKQFTTDFVTQKSSGFKKRKVKEDRKKQSAQFELEELINDGSLKTKAQITKQQFEKDIQNELQEQK